MSASLSVSSNTIRLSLTQKTYETLNDESISYLTSLTYYILIITPLPILTLSNLYNHINYLISVLLINLEYKFPLIFSPFGSRYLKIQYNWLKWYINQIISTGDTTKIFVKNLFNLQQSILHEFNTINIWKQLNRSTISKRLFIKDISLIKEVTKVKNLVFSYKLISEEEEEEETKEKKEQKKRKK